MPRGGRREGAGRPRSDGTRQTSHNASPSREVAITREVIAERLSKASLPGAMKAVEVMRENMMWGREVGSEMLKKCKEAADRGEVVVAVDFLNESRKLRGFTQKCAEALAPFETPRLSALAPPPEEIEPPMKDITPTAEPKDHLAHLTQRYKPFAVGKKERA